MKPSPNVEMTRFTEALSQVMKVSKADMTAMLKNDDTKASVRQPKGPRPKPSASDLSSSLND
jgi:hypothetical protein